MKNVTAIVALIIAMIALSIAVVPYISGTKTSPINLGTTSISCLNPTILRSGEIMPPNFPIHPHAGIEIEIDMPSNGIMTGQLVSNVSGMYYLLNATQENEMGSSLVPPSYLYTVTGKTFNLDFRLSGVSGFTVTYTESFATRTESFAETPYNIVFYNPTSDYANLNITQPIEMC